MEEYGEDEFHMPYYDNSEKSPYFGITTPLTLFLNHRNLSFNVWGNYRICLHEILARSPCSQEMGRNALHNIVEWDYSIKNEFYEGAPHYEQTLSLLKHFIKENPKILIQRDNSPLNFTPVEFAIWNFCDEPFIKFLIDQLYEHHGKPTEEELDKLLKIIHAQKHSSRYNKNLACYLESRQLEKNLPLIKVEIDRHPYRQDHREGI